MRETSKPLSSEPRANGPHGPGAVSLAEHCCADLVERWRRGERVPAEAYLRRYPQLGDQTAFELILTEVVLRQEYGEPAPLEEFLWRFPHFAERLRRHFALHATLTATPSGGQARALILAPPSTPTPPAENLPTVPGYEILGEIGRGGMGVVFKAREPHLGRFVALKILPAEYARDPDRLERFLREARTASALNHPHICTVHALGEHEGRPFIVMEFIEGITLQALAARGPEVQEVARLIGQAARALAAAHAAGVVHRDVKPENIMERADGYVKVLDFGLARRLPTLAQPDAGGRDTDPGTLIGTVAYMSPEQARGAAAESASDVFALGIVLYQLVTGKHPFEAASALDMLSAIATRQPVPPSRLNPAVPAALEALTEAMLHKDPRLRPTAAEVETAMTALANPARQRAAPPMAARPIVHREPELAALRAALDRADAGRGSAVCVAGEPGIGKTTLIEDFLDGLATAGRPCLVARGHCSERLADTEAYLPVIDALDDLLRGEASGSVARLMQAVAPAWYSQVVAAVGDKGQTEGGRQEAEGGRQKTEGGEKSGRRSPPENASSQQAMLREFCGLLQETSRLGPVVWFIDDVHWADFSTVDLLAHLGRHIQGMRVLVIVTYRPTELLLGPHPFYRVMQELQTKGVCTELALGFLGRQDIDAYLALVFPGTAFPPGFADLIHARTEGSPLFMVHLLRYLRERGVIAESGGRWSLARELPDLRQELPGSVRSMIQRKLELLEDGDRRLLAAASVQGNEFDSAVVSGALGLNAAEVEERLQVLERIHGLVQRVRENEFPDRTLTLRYAFVHILYQQALYADLPPTRKAALSTALARALDGHFGEGNRVAAAELACLYEVGRDFYRAAQQLHLAAQNAASVFAHREAVVLARRGLRLVEALPETPERAALELPLQTTLGMQLQVTEGFAAPEAKQAYSRARALCPEASGSAPLFPVLWGLWLFSKVRSDLARAQEMADELQALARQLQDPDLALQAHQARGMTAFCRGEPAAAVQQVEQATALYDTNRHRPHSYLFGQDPGVICKAYGAVALWLLGYPEQAQRQSDAAIRMSRELSPSSQAVALHFAAMLHQLCRDGSRVRACAESSCTIAVEHGFSFWLAGGSVLSGWAQAACGSLEEGVNRLRQGLLDWMATDSVTYKTYYLGLLAEVLLEQGRLQEAGRVLEEALALARQTGEGLYEAELYRLRGMLTLRGRDESEATIQQRAETDFRRALDIARRQEAKSLELRAAISLSHLYRQQDRRAEIQPLLGETCGWFTEGLDDRDLREARAILEEVV